MLKKIAIDQLRLGMYVHDLCGSWLDHPFWRTSFLLRDPRDAGKLRAGGVSECWIDTAKGLDVTPAAEPGQPDHSGSEATSAQAPESAALTFAAANPVSLDRVSLDRVSLGRVRLEDEADRARILCAEARQAVVALHEQARMGRTLDLEGCMPLVDGIAASLERNSAALIGLVRLKSHDDYTFMHSVAVCALAVALARRLGFDEPETREIGLAALLHDIGKAGVPLEVLNKPGRLTDAEFDIVKLHPRYGYELLLEAGTKSETALQVCLHHHERFDGNGYPGRLGGDALALSVRIVSVCDVYDAITSHRPYSNGCGPAEAIRRMALRAKAGQFDPRVFRAFVECIGIYPIGSLVRLQSERLAVVTEQNNGSLLAPRVKAFYSIREQMPIPVESVDLGRPACLDRIIARESNDQWRFPYLDELSIAPLTSSTRKGGVRSSTGRAAASTAAPVRAVAGPRRW